MLLPKPKHKKQYCDATLIAVMLQIPMTILLSLATFAETLLQLWLFALSAYWLGYAIIRIRRPKTPTRLDCFLIKWGILPLLIITCFLADFIWGLRGLKWR